jgi:hypothetical protein
MQMSQQNILAAALQPAEEPRAYSRGLREFLLEKFFLVLTTD